VHADVTVHKLGNVQIGGDAGQAVRFHTRQILLAHEEVHHLLHADLGRLREILVHPHRDVVRGRLCHRPAQVHVLPDNELKPAGE